ncbi:MAG: ABC transporter ATP-binding protein [Candidatus Neomarinimicrobiota bacterium]
MLQITNLTKQFKKIKAVDNISLKVQKGDIYGFLGPNGAGKTTSIRMIMGIIKPDNGTIKLNASDINTINRRKLGYLPEDRGLYQKQNLSEILYYFGCLKGLDKKDSKNRANLWLERFNLDDQKERKVEELSKGNQQKIQFIIALLHDPQLIILDEPFTGLDPVNQILLKEVIKEKQQEGKTIIFSTHQMEQVERLCNNICLINKGNILLEGPLSEIRKSHSEDVIELNFSGKIDNSKLEVFFSDFELKEDTLSGVLKKKKNEFLEWIIPQVSIESFNARVPSLEQIFIKEVGK